ncbi:MAG TPA: DUF899 family protein [Burkholderiales bacterium]
MNSNPLAPAAQMAAKNQAHFPNESPAYRQARNALLAEEIELRRHIERVAAQRRALPPGGEVTQDFRFEGEEGAVSLADLFGDKQTLAIYSFMYGPQRKQPCPMCTSVLGSWDGIAPDANQRLSLVFIARSPLKRLLEYKKQRGMQHVRMYSDTSGEFTRAYVNKDDADMPGLNIFTRAGGKIRHFYAGEMGMEQTDPGQDPRGAPELSPLWTILDFGPEGRAPDWCPSLEYPK